MSRADAYGAYCRESRLRLLHQTYAFCGNTEVARRALADAYVAASHHWRKVADLPDRDAWMRDHAFRATTSPQNRARRPWYQSAKSTADGHRTLLMALSQLSPTDRTVVIVHAAVGLDLAHAGREAGITDAAAAAVYDAAMVTFADAGVDTRPAPLKAAFDELREDLRDEPIEDVKRLRREGNRRRRSHLMLAGISVLALAVGAGALTATQTPATETNGTPLIPGSGPTSQGPEDLFSTQKLASVSTVSTLDGPHRWKVMLTTSDFGADQPLSPCLASGPAKKGAVHFWVRQFSAGHTDDPTQATQSLEVEKSEDKADAAYNELVRSASTCRGGSRELTDYGTVSGLGDSASMFNYRYVVGEEIRNEQLTIVRTGVVVTVWVIRPAGPDPVRTNLVLRAVGRSVDDVCSAAGGHCANPPYKVTPLVPPPVPGAEGFLSTVDLPVFAGVAQPWVATPPAAATGANPSATPCDQADFDGAGAQTVAARSFVIPEARQLPDIFGMTETSGAFATDDSARSFVDKLHKSVATCEKKQLNAKVRYTHGLHDEGVVGTAWEIRYATSKKKTITYRVAVVRVGSSVAQLTFTPTTDYDLTRAAFDSLAVRAAERLRQG